MLWKPDSETGDEQTFLSQSMLWESQNSVELETSGDFSLSEAYMEKPDSVELG
jgi:hypothetical protein